jgi:flagellar assembly protein FliH
MGRLLKRTGRLVPAAVVSAKEEAARLVADARAEAASARAALATELGSAREDAERRGYEAGLAAGREAAHAEVTELLVAARADADAARLRSRDAAVVLARRMAEKIVGRAVTLAPEVMGEIVAQALAASRARAGAVVVRVHPEDLAALEKDRPRWAARLSAAAEVRLAADPSVGRHGCVVETPVGRLDARLGAQLDALERAISRSDVPEPR